MKAASKSPKPNFLKRHPVYLSLFLCFTVVAFCIIFITAMTTSIQHPIGTVLFFASLYAIVFALAAVLLIAFFRWACCWRNFKRFLFGIACAITLVALLYAEEDIRGKYDWDSYKSQWEAKGEKYDYSDFVPAAVPDDQNFAMSPVWIADIKYNFQNNLQTAETWYGRQINDDDVAKYVPLFPCTPEAITGTNWYNRWSDPPTPDIAINWTISRVVDLQPWQAYYRNLESTNPVAQISITAQPQTPAADVLLALSKYDPLIEQLQQDSSRPESRFPIAYDVDDPAEILLPHLAALKKCAQVLELRGVAELQNNQSDRAFDDVKLMLRLESSVRTEPFIISRLVRMVILRMSLQVIYEGLSRHQWSDAQLAEMDADLAKIDYLADYQASVRAELVTHVKVLGWIEQKRSRSQIILPFLQGNNNRFRRGLPLWAVAAEFYAMPGGWFDRGYIQLAEWHRCWATMPVDDAKHLASPTLVSQTQLAAKKLPVGQAGFNVLASLMVPELSSYVERTAFNQECADLARTAIALERYYLAHGNFPGTLDALSPQPPHDIITGEPLHYHRTDDGQFVLYSVGWNGTDDGGVAVPQKGQESGINMAQGDWVWKYPAR
jgi:hypothetical protein